MSRNKEAVIREKLAIMIEIATNIVDISYSDICAAIKESSTYKELENDNFCVMYDSPQANLSAIGEELRERGHWLGNIITDDNIIKAMINMREQNLKRR